MTKVIADVFDAVPRVRCELPGPIGAAHWAREQAIIGPGLQQVVLWGQLTFVRGRGPFLQDADGNVFVDFFGGSGVNSIGHAHPDYVKALSEQLQDWMIGGFGSQARLAMLEALSTVLPAGLDRVQLYTSGSEAVEAALRLCKSYTKKFEFLSFWNGFHGKTMGSIGLTDGEKRMLGPAAPGFLSTPYADCGRCAFNQRFPECAWACVEHAREVLRRQGSGSLAGIVVEPLQGRAGNLPAPPGFLRELKKLAREHDALLIVDETMTGFGRTGRMFCSEYDEVVPDIMIVGKGMGGGFPVTGVIASAEIMAAQPYSNPSASSSSFGGFPLACRAVEATLNVITSENLVERSATLGAELLAMLERTAREVPLVGAVRGRGLMIGIEIVDDKATRRPASKETLRRVYQALLREGILVMTGGSSVRLYPPLNIAAPTARRTIESIDRVLRRESGLDH